MSWNDPKNDYVAGDQVTPSIFNELANNEQYLYDKRCETVTRDGTTETQVNEMVLYKDGSVYKPKTRSNGTITDLPIGAKTAESATTLNGGWTTFTNATTLPYGVYLIKVDIGDNSSGVGIYGTTITDVICMLAGSASEYECRSYDNPSGPIHNYVSNGAQGNWYRTARIKITSYNTTGFKLNLYVSESGGYATSSTDIKGTNLYPEKAASSLTNFDYKMKYKRIL